MSIAKWKPARLSVVIWPVELIPVGESDGVHQDIDLSESFCSLPGHPLDLFILGDITGGDEGAAQRFGQRADAPLQSLSGVAKADPGALLVKGLGDPPGDRAFVRNAENQCGLPFQKAHGFLLNLENREWRVVNWLNGRLVEW
jgi:hypothetical protein